MVREEIGRDFKNRYKQFTSMFQFTFGSSRKVTEFIMVSVLIRHCKVNTRLEIIYHSFNFFDLSEQRRSFHTHRYWDFHGVLSIECCISFRHYLAQPVDEPLKSVSICQSASVRGATHAQLFPIFKYILQTDDPLSFTIWSVFVRCLAKKYSINCNKNLGEKFQR